MPLLLRTPILSIVALLAVQSFAFGQEATPAGMARIEGATYAPFYPDVTGLPITVDSFAIDIRPVTNAEFLAFVEASPRWRKSSVPTLFADDGYLSHWAGDTELGPNAPADHPVTYVSWFAASDYCRAQGKRLPDEAEWEWVARADATRRDATSDPAFNQAILAWYSTPSRGGGPARSAGSGVPNLWGVRDLHGLIWEWVSDFNSSIVSGDSRQTGDREMDRFCGGAAASAADVSDYASFMRFAMRGSLRATYAVHNLGFRCAID